MTKIGKIIYGSSGMEPQYSLPIYSDGEYITADAHKSMQLVGKKNFLGKAYFTTGWKFSWNGQTYGNYELKYIKSEHIVDRIIGIINKLKANAI